MSQDHSFLLERQQWVEASLDETFAFFADAANLESITPPWLGFRIITPLPIDMATGIQIDYTIRMGPVPLRWRTLIAHWNPPHGFVDTQLRGPYALWEHTHGFEPMADGTLLTDTVRYRLPFGALGRVVHGLAVRASLSAIFDYRYRRVAELLGDDRGQAPAPHYGVTSS